MGAQATIDQFFSLCDAGGPNCAFAPSSAERFARLARKLLKGPITIVDPGGHESKFRYQDLIGNACVLGLGQPSSYQAWHDQGAIADERFGYFGRLWTWISSICARWPGFDGARYMGPFTRRTANPVLVIGNLFDPGDQIPGSPASPPASPELLTPHR